MKKIFFIILTLISFNSLAQVPEGIPYQAVARDAAGIPLSNHIVNVRFSILDSVATGLAVYTETHTTNTNNLGSFTVNLGKGTPVLNSFTSINWGVNSKFLKVEIDTSSGSNYIEVGTQQMMSVPYALYAFNASFSANGVPVGKHGETCLSCWGKAVWSSSGKCPQISSTCGSPNVHSAILNYGNVVDIDGNTYKTIKIGNKIWMAENLKVTRYNNGEILNQAQYINSGSQLDTTGSFVNQQITSGNHLCAYGYDYNYYAAQDSRNVCPTGWHVSNNFDWDSLLIALEQDPNLSQWNSEVSKHLRPIGFDYWKDWNLNISGDNLLGFAALPSISPNYNESLFWCFENSTDYFAYYLRGMPDVNGGGLAKLSPTYNGGYTPIPIGPWNYASIRCVKD